MKIGVVFFMFKKTGKKNPRSKRSGNYKGNAFSYLRKKEGISASSADEDKSGFLSSADLRPVTNWNREGLVFSAGFAAGVMTGAAAGAEEEGAGENKSSPAGEEEASCGLTSVSGVSKSKIAGWGFSEGVIFGVKRSNEAGCLLSLEPNNSFGSGIAGRLPVVLEENETGCVSVAGCVVDGCADETVVSSISSKSSSSADSVTVAVEKDEICGTEGVSETA